MASFATQLAPKPRKSVRWEDHDHPISDVMSIVDGVREERSSSSILRQNNNQRIGSIIPLPPTVQPASANKHLTFSTGLRPNTVGRRESLQTGPVRVHKSIKTKKHDASRRRRHAHQHPNVHHHTHHFPHPLPPLTEEGTRSKIIIEVDETDGDDELGDDTPSSASSLDNLGDIESMVPTGDIGSERFYKDLLDNLVSKRARYETEISGGGLYGADRRLMRKRLRDVKNDMVILMRRRGDFQVVVAMSGLDEETKKECLGQLARSILKSEVIEG